MKSERNNELDQDKVEVLNQVADFIIVRKLEVIALLYIESMRPLHRLSSNLLIFFQPFLEILISGNKLVLFRECLEQDKYIDYLVDRLEKS